MRVGVSASGANNSPMRLSCVRASEHALNSRPLDDEDDPRRWLAVGIDQSGRVLELVVLVSMVAENPSFMP